MTNTTPLSGLGTRYETVGGVVIFLVNKYIHPYDAFVVASFEGLFHIDLAINITYRNLSSPHLTNQF